MDDSPTFAEALRKQREAFADRDKASDDLTKYVDELFGDNEELSHD